MMLVDAVRPLDLERIGEPIGKRPLLEDSFSSSSGCGLGAGLRFLEDRTENQQTLTETA